MGFAKGNNYGINESKKYNPDFIVVLNSDVIISDQYFENKIYQQYKKSKFDILGPDIYCPPLQIHQNPKRLKSYSKDEVIKDIKKYNNKCRNLFFVKLRCIIKKNSWIKSSVYKLRKKKSNIDYKKTYENVILHGSCVIFSKKYFNNVQNCFNDKTFMYMEMEILDFICKKNNFKECYSPDIHVIHNHNASTNYTYKKEFDKVVFMNKCIYDSLKNFKKIMEDMNE